MDYMTLKEAGQKWNVTPLQINYLCAAGRIPGSVKMAGIWLLPQNCGEACGWKNQTREVAKT